MDKQYITDNVQKTKKLGEKLAEELLKTKKSLVIGLAGELGGGKTTFIQGFARGLGIKEKILSPTFVIMKRFKVSKSLEFYHIDCYRVEKTKELLDLGFKEIVSDPHNIVVVEWADKIKKIMPKNTIWINFKFVSEKKRKIIFSGDSNFMLRSKYD